VQSEDVILAALPERYRTMNLLMEDVLAFLVNRNAA